MGKVEQTFPRKRVGSLLGSMTSRESGCRVEWTAAAEADLRELRTFDARPIVQAVEELRHQAEIRTRNRKAAG